GSIMGRARYSATAILRQLDRCAEELDFPMLDNGYFYPGDVRLSAYRDERRWALVIEVLGFLYRAGLPHGLTTKLYRFGNCLPQRLGQGNDHFLHVVDNDPDRPAFDPSGYDEELLPGAEVIRIRGQTVPIPRDPGEYAARGIAVGDVLRLRGEEL